MQIILLDKVVNLGNLGEIVKVKDGYARNFLILRAVHAVPPKLPRQSSKPSALNSKRLLPPSWQKPKPKARSWLAPPSS